MPHVRFRRVIATVVLYWALGAMVSVGLAWGLDLWAPRLDAVLQGTPIEDGPWPRPVPGDWPALAMRSSKSNAWMTEVSFSAYLSDSADPLRRAGACSVGWPRRVVSGAWFDGRGKYDTEGLRVPG
jgi:hypothetical protein